MVFFDVVNETDIACSRDICDDVQPSKNRSANNSNKISINDEIGTNSFNSIKRPLDPFRILMSNKQFIVAFLSSKIMVSV